MVLTHLILNGMIKVKGQLGEMAKCLEDPDQRISDLAKLFFTELSTKDNALYNNLQDVISHLSIGAHAVNEETFERTMRFIFTFIEKVSVCAKPLKRHTKLMHQNRKSRQNRLWRNCVSDSGRRQKNDSGETFPTVFRSCHSNLTDPSRNSSRGASYSYF